jgi:hypothetical protein
VEAPPPWPRERASLASDPASGRGDAGCESAELFLPSLPDANRLEPSPACGGGLGGGVSADAVFEAEASRFATSSLVPRVEARARCAAASPPERRSQELSGGGCNPVPEPMPASPRLIAGLSNSAKAGPIGCTSGRDALEFGVFDFAGFRGVSGRVSGFLAMPGIWDESEGEKRAKAFEDATSGTVLFHCQQMSAQHRHCERSVQRRHSGMVR